MVIIELERMLDWHLPIRMSVKNAQSREFVKIIVAIDLRKTVLKK